jgi:CheY-like chemotaxis protein
MANAKCRILCVDDHQDTSEMLKILLGQEDIEVLTALSIEEAIELSRLEPFDLYVLDKRLPDGSGLELCEQLQLLAPGVPCIFYTGDAYDIHRQEALAAGAEAFVPKPEIEKLIKTVHDILANQTCTTAG